LSDNPTIRPWGSSVLPVQCGVKAAMALKENLGCRLSLVFGRHNIAIFLN
jgi:hypothetical protein